MKDRGTKGEAGERWETDLTVCWFTTEMASTAAREERGVKGSVSELCRAGAVMDGDWQPGGGRAGLPCRDRGHVPESLLLLPQDLPRQAADAGTLV